MIRFADFEARRGARSFPLWQLLLLTICCSGCTQSSDSKLPVVRIGYQKTGTLNLVRLRGTLDDDLRRAGYGVEWFGFSSGPQLLEALNAGAIVFGHVGDAPPILAQSAGVSFVYVACAPPRAQEEAILVLADSSLRTVADLKGKRIALNKGSNVHYLLARVLKSAGVPYDSVQTVFLAPSDARAAFTGRSVDAWAAWDPYLAEAELNAGARVLADGEGLVTNRELHLASPTLVAERPEVIHTIIAGLNREDEWAKAHPDEVAAMIAAELGLEQAVIRRMIDRKGYGVAWIGDEVLSEQQQVADTLLELGLIPEPIDVRDAALPESFPKDAAAFAEGGGRTDNHKE
jgi:sulfonate transport system substrate-binding protein